MQSAWPNLATPNRMTHTHQNLSASRKLITPRPAANAARPQNNPRLAGGYRHRPVHTPAATSIPSRVYPLAEDRLPALSVTTGSEEVGENSTRQSDFRQLEAMVEIIVKGNASFEDTADQIAFEVEAAVHAAAPPNNVLSVALDRSEPARDGGERAARDAPAAHLPD